MYEAFLSHSQVEEYLDFLLAKELISLAPDKKHYLPTEKGVRFLAMYEDIRDAVALTREKSISPEAEPGPSSALNELTPRTSQQRQAVDGPD
jgi:Winged helix-turn-helix